METSIDLKLNLNSLSGILENGNKYRVFFKTEFNKDLNEYSLELIVKDSSKYFNTWLHNTNLSVRKWYKKGGYTKCLRDSLIELEENLGVQILKSTMKIAV